MFNTKKLSHQDLEELRERTKMVNQHILIVQALEIQKQIYVKGLFPKYGLDGNKNYNISLETGRLTEKPIAQKEK